MQRRIEEMAPSVVAGYGCNATVDWRLDEQVGWSDYYYIITVYYETGRDGLRDVTRRG
jgi:hypothetical protein